ncbi:MAG: hypothetical protein JWO37_1983 [Acidimicrobiales bacterium]|jgi:hypothetical protein|nr:hypothetical protein [Acidimicrobiales bacterium]
MRLVGLSRGMREVLALPGYAAVDQLEVAEAAWSLATDLGLGWGPFEPGNDALVDFVVGVVEAIDEFIAVAESRGEWPRDVALRAEAEAAAWVDDFLYDNPNVRFPAATGDATDVSLFTVAQHLAQALAAAVSGVRPDR